MPDDAKPASRWLIRSLVVLTTLLCLGTAGYAGQVLWAKRVAAEPWIVTGTTPYGLERTRADTALMWESDPTRAGLIRTWRSLPPWGAWWDGRWYPRRAYYEALKRWTGQSLPNDPSVWEAWFRDHPDLVWDDEQKQLTGPPKP